MSDLSPDDFADVVVTAIKTALQPFAVRMKAVEAEIGDVRAELRSKAAPGDQRIRELEAEVAQLTDTICATAAAPARGRARCGDG